MIATILQFPRPKPNAIQVQFDFGEWTIAYYCDHRFLSRLTLISKAAAEAEAERLALTGLVWRRGLNGYVYIFPDSADGGCWAVAHRSRSDDSDGLLARHFSLDDAVSDAKRLAAELGADFSSNDHFDHGGAA